jgi:PAS domain S-box-containing protein
MTRLGVDSTMDSAADVMSSNGGKRYVTDRISELRGRCAELETSNQSLKRSVADRIGELRVRCAELETSNRSLRRDLLARSNGSEPKTRIVRRDRYAVDEDAWDGPASGIFASGREQTFRLGFDVSPFAQCFIDATGMVCSVNRAALRLFGVAPGDCFGAKLVDLIADEAASAFEAFLVAVLVGERPNGAHMDVQLKVRAVPVRLTVALTIDGVDTLCLVSITDLGELRAVQEDEARFRRIAAHVEDVYYEADQQGRVAYLSSAYGHVWKRDPRSAHDKFWFHAVHADDLEHVIDAQRLLLKGDPFDEEYRIILPDGQVRWVRDRACLVDVPHPHIVGVARDITDDRDLEEELRQGQKLEALGALAGSVAHDFGNLLQGVMGCLNMALSKSTSSERSQEYTRQALAAVRSGAALVGQLTKFGRKEQTSRKPIAPDAAIAGCAKLLQRLLGDHIELCIEAGAGGAMIMADPIQIEQILMNLAANARDAMPGGGRLVIRTAAVWQKADGAGRGTPMVRLEVRDLGCGMDREMQARLFEPFFTTKEPGKGTGLGLSTVRSVTRTLGGQVEVESALGEGTAFVFMFPCVATPCPLVEPRELPEARFSGRALLVEDDWRVRISVRQYLEDLGFEVVEAADPVEALSRAIGSFSVLVSDVVLPEVSGRHIRDILKSRHPDLKALYISAHSARYLTEQGLLEKGDVILQKPFERRELAFRLAEMWPAAPLPPARRGAVCGPPQP